MNVVRVMLIILIAGFVWRCGSSGKLTSEEDAILPSEREKIRSLENDARKHPENLKAHKDLYQIYLKNNMRPSAIAVMKGILKRSPGQVEVRYNCGVAQYREKKYSEAYENFLLVLESEKGDGYKASISRYAGGNFSLKQVTSGPGDKEFPAFSPDNRKIIYQKKRGDSWDIVEFDLSSTRETVLMDAPADEEGPTYAPDGAIIAYTSTAEDRRPVPSGYKVREIAITFPPKRTMINLTRSAADDWSPRYSHDGRYLLFVSDRNDLREIPAGAKQSDLFLMEKNGAFPQRLTHTPDNEGGGCFSSDDKFVFFHSDKNGNYDLYMMRLDNRKPMTVVDDKSGNDITPGVSQDGKSIVFVSDRDGNQEVYRANIDGSAQERLTFHPGIDASPVFSPDGKKIAFHSNRNGHFDIFLMEISPGDAFHTTGDLIEQLKKMIRESS